MSVRTDKPGTGRPTPSTGSRGRGPGGPGELEDGGWGATVVGGGGAGRGRVVRRTLLVLLAIVVVVAGLGLGAVVHASGRMERVAVDGLTASGRPLHILVVGSDTREGLTPEEQAELATGEFDGNRTDTIFVMTIRGGRVGLLAFPRDLFVTRCDGSEGRINAAMSVGGPGCLVQTVSQLSGIPISHYLELDFLGFRDIVDAVGGVELCLDRPITDDFAGIDLPAGCQVLDGADALGYVRVRKIDNDLERIKRQQQFLRALANELVSPSTAVNPLRLYRTSGSVGAALKADEGLGTIALLRLAFGMRGLATGASVTHTVPTTPATIGGASVLLPVEGEAEALFARFRDGSILDEAAAALRPADVQVAVLNGAGISGLAGATADALRAAGFTVTQVDDAPEQVPATVIAHPPGQRPQADVLARQLPGEVPVEERAGLSVVTLLLGPDAAPPSS